jgi:glutaredoxin
MDQKILDKITQNPNCYIIFYSQWCTYSLRALDLLRSNNVCYKGYLIESIKGDMPYLLSVFKSNTDKLNYDNNHNTRPIIFYDSKYIGGYSELNALFNQ